MDMKEIENRLEYIKSIADDDESADAAEDDLMIEFIKYVSTLKLPIGMKAKKVLEVKGIKFARWYA